MTKLVISLLDPHGYQVEELTLSLPDAIVKIAEFTRAMAEDKLPCSIRIESYRDTENDVCEHCGCKLTKQIGGLEHHASDCPNFPL